MRRVCCGRQCSLVVGISLQSSAWLAQWLESGQHWRNSMHPYISTPMPPRGGLDSNWEGWAIQKDVLHFASKLPHSHLHISRNCQGKWSHWYPSGQAKQGGSLKSSSKVSWTGLAACQICPSLFLDSEATKAVHVHTIICTMSCTKEPRCRQTLKLLLTQREQLCMYRRQTAAVGVV